MRVRLSSNLHDFLFLGRQKLTDKHVADIEQLLVAKEKEIMQV